MAGKDGLKSVGIMESVPPAMLHGTTNQASPSRTHAMSPNRPL